jgi:hypothetical protein
MAASLNSTEHVVFTIFPNLTAQLMLIFRKFLTLAATDLSQLMPEACGSGITYVVPKPHGM